VFGDAGCKAARWHDSDRLLVEIGEMGPMSWWVKRHVPLKDSGEGYLWADAKDEQYVQPYKVPVGRHWHVSMVRARAPSATRID